MSETWTNLLSGAVGAIFGAIVGGTFSLLGARLAIRQQMATNARWRLYDELLPKLADAVDSVIDPQVPEDQMAEVVIPELLAKVRRAGAIAGRQERRGVHKLTLLWSEYESATKIDIPNTISAADMLEASRKLREESTPEGMPQPDPYAGRRGRADALLSEMRQQIRTL